MAKNPDARYRSAGELAAAAENALNPATPTREWAVEPPPPPISTTHRLQQRRGHLRRRGFGSKFHALPAGGGSAISIPIPASSHGIAVASADNLYVLTGAVADSANKTIQPGQVLKIVPEK